MTKVLKITFLFAIFLTMHSDKCFAQNNKRSGLSQLEFDHSKTPKDAPQPTKSLTPTEEIYRIMNNQKQINDLKNNTTKEQVVPESSEKPQKRIRGMGQLD